MHVSLSLRLRRIVACTTTLGTTGCLALPIPNTEILAPSLVGHVEQRDGKPVAGLRLVVSTSESCARPTASGATDSSGHFRLETPPNRRHWMMVSLMEYGISRYWMCTSSGDSLRPMFEGKFQIRARGPLLDSLQCRSYAPDGDRARVACA